MIKIAIILGSTRPNRNGEAVAKWVCEVAKTRSDAESELVDIKDFNLPLLDEPVPPSMGQYRSCYLFLPTSKTSAFSSPVQQKYSLLMTCWIKSSLGAAC